jgi:hypothetical protein
MASSFGSGALRVADDRRHVLGQFAPVFPDLIAVDRVDRQHTGTRAHHIHHALCDDRRGFRCAGRQAARPRHLELADVALVDLIERAEALLVVGPVDHQPVAGRRIGELVACYRLEAVRLRRDIRRESESTKHRCCDVETAPYHASLPDTFLGPAV